MQSSHFAPFRGRSHVTETPTKNSSGLNRMSPALTGSSESVSSNPGGGSSATQLQQQSQVQSCDRQFVTIVSEKQARVVALPSQNCVYKYQISDADFVVKSEVISMKGIPHIRGAGSLQARSPSGPS